MRVRITADIEVTNPERLRQYAAERFAACWGSLDDFPEDLPAQVLEAMLLSSESPSPDEIGIAFIDHSATEVAS